MKKLYMVMWQDKRSPKEVPMVGYLPLHEIPHTSLLRRAIFSKDECLEIDGGCGGALKGIYEKRKLAEEHMRIERAWRGKYATFWLQVIEAPKVKTGRKKK